MKIALIGYGKMGKAIEQLCLEREHEIVAIIETPIDSMEKIKEADVAIEFTMPESAVKNINTCFDYNVPVVVGTTGWYESYEEVVANSKEKDGCLFTATNFSLGVNVFFKLNEYLAKLMNNFSDYSIKMDEVHHTQKLDAPSGTAITLAHGIIDEVYRKDKWLSIEEGNKQIPEALELPIHSFREDNVPGTHSIHYDSPIDSIEIKHTAHSRKGFALGAVLAAEFIKGKKGILGMNDMLKLH
jgi:4-hydroxy-tetrahydrodipicolinate reductase